MSGIFITGEVHIVFAILILGPVAIVGLAYLYLAVKDPGKLRSEKHETLMAALEVIQEKGGPVQIASVGERLDIRQNVPPPLKNLSSKEDGE